MDGAERPCPVVLCVVDGFGEREGTDGNAIVRASTPRLDEIRLAFPTTSLRASGACVGLSEGHTGNGYVGHRTIGAGRVVPIEQSRIGDAIAKRELGRNPMIAQALRIAADRGTRLHLLGLVSRSTVHASMDHLHALIELADFHEVPVVLHAVLDGRDMPPKSAMPLLHRLEDFLLDRGAIGTLSGRMYSVDAGDDWDRVHALYHAIVRDDVLGAEAQRADTPLDALSLAYGQGLSDATVPPTRIGGYDGIRGDFLCDFGAEKPVWEWMGEEVGIGFNHRPDGLSAIVSMLTHSGLPAEVTADLLVDRGKPVLAFGEHCFTSLTEYDGALGLPVAFGGECAANTCGALIAEAGLQQLRIGESLTRAHVTSFFGGGRSAPLDGEERRIIPSAPVLDLAEPVVRPRTEAIAAAAVRAIDGGRHDFILVSLPGAEMVARTGDLEATVRAVEQVDRAIGELVTAVRRGRGALLLTSDHGHCELMGSAAADLAASPTDSPVPLYYVNPSDDGARLAGGGQLSDVAPTVLRLLGVAPPSTMTGRCLLQSSAWGRES